MSAPADHLFPDLDSERAHLALSRRARDAMVARLEAVDPDASADEISKEYVEVTVADALADLRAPGAGDFFGRIDDQHGRWYVGRRHIEDDRHDPVVVDWRAPISAPFYRATAVDPLGVDFRRRFTIDDGDLVAYLDEHLDDPESGVVAGGIPDPVLAEIGAARTGTMRDIVATIQGEQDVVIRSPIDQVLIVQGGPGTGKTAVALHRAAYLLFEHRARLSRDGVLVVGPNRAFLDYISNVLPSLGERSVMQTTVAEMCVPRVDVSGADPADLARWKGSADRLPELEAFALAAIQAPPDDIVIPVGSRRHVVSSADFATWVANARDGVSPINERRERLRVIARRELLRRTGSEEAWSAAAPLKAAINRAWPTQKPTRLVDRFLPGPRGRRRVWTPADQLLVDEANSLLNGTPFTYGHVVVDEAQDHSAVGLRVIARRSPSRSMTLVGDVAQSTSPAGQERWADVFRHVGVADPAARPLTDPLTNPLTEPVAAAVTDRATENGGATIADLTIGYRVPAPILDVANRLLPLTGVDARPSRSVRVAGEPPRWVRATGGGGDERVVEVAQSTADAIAAVHADHPLTGVVATDSWVEPIRTRLSGHGFRLVDHVHDLDTHEIPVFGPEQVKGLEFDGVVVVEPGEILTEGTATPTARGARLLYVAMTRAVQTLVFVTAGEPLPLIADPA